MLAERLTLGGALDEELLSRARRCALWFDEAPLQRLAWLPALRRAAAGALHRPADLWASVERLLDPRRGGRRHRRRRPRPRPREPLLPLGWTSPPALRDTAAEARVERNAGIMDNPYEV